MLLLLADAEKVYTIKKVGGREDSRRFIESLGFVSGGDVTVVSKGESGLIVNVKESRVAISPEMGGKITVEPKKGVPGKKLAHGN
ncbi:MAG: ferrous iron transport protein A [Synergistaceae bacterium]|jgi:ferrous iron transport protein A|nr:ferrous iron transport protein A [Synergistaceae bacterium]